MPSAQSDAQVRGGGASFGSPSAQPASAQSARVAISPSDNTRASRNGPPSVVEAGHGGIVWRAVTVDDVRRPLPRLLVRQQPERRHLARPVAVLAVLLEDADHLAVVGRRPLPSLGPRHDGQRPEHEQQPQPHQPTSRHDGDPPDPSATRPGREWPRF